MDKKKTETERQVERILAFLEEVKPDSEAYNHAMINLKLLYEVLNSEKKYQEKEEVKVDRFANWPIPPELLVPAVTNILGIVLILNFENAHALTSKAIQWIGRRM